jgi:hypothetical protein
MLLRVTKAFCQRKSRAEQGTERASTLNSECMYKHLSPHALNGQKIAIEVVLNAPMNFDACKGLEHTDTHTLIHH